MLIIEKIPLENGAHRNQSGASSVPDGWVVAPPELEAEALTYLPFIELTIVGGELIAVAQGEIPEPEPLPPEPITADDILKLMCIQYGITEE